MSKLSFIGLQDRLIRRVIHSHPGHRSRVRRSAAKELRRTLEARGYPADSIRAVVRDALDVATLELNAEDC